MSKNTVYFQRLYSFPICRKERVILLFCFAHRIDTKRKQKHTTAAQLQHVCTSKLTTRKKDRGKAKEASSKRNNSCTQTEALLLNVDL